MGHDSGLAETVASQHEVGQAPKEREKRASAEFQARMGMLCAEYHNGQRALESFHRAAGRRARPQYSRR